jgi:hypothetical protein
MVRRIPSLDVKQFILVVGTKLRPEMEYWAPINLGFLGESWQRADLGGMAQTYGLFIAEEPVGMLLGMMFPDLNSGYLQGMEFFWGVEKKFRSKALGLLRQFEKDCKEAGCKAVITGSIRSMEPDKMRRLYGYLGYKPHAVEFLKRL